MKSVSSRYKAFPGFAHRILSIPLYPFLLAVCPILILYQWNADQLAPVALQNPLLVVLGSAFLIWGLCWILIRSVNKAALITAYILFQSDLTGGILEYCSVGGRLPLDWAFLFALLSASGLGFTVWIIRKAKSPRSFDPFNRRANFVLLLLTIIIPLRVAIDEIGNHLAWKIQPNSVFVVHHRHEKPRPDIYYIILDGYARQDVLADFFHYDNSAFIQFLQKRGFYVAPKSRCNYSVTYLSMASALNMQYLDALNKNPEQQEQASRMMRQNRISADLKLNGYHIVHFGTGFPMDDVNLLADQTYSSTSLDEFRILLLKTSFLRFLLSDVLDNSYRQRFYFNCEKLSDLPQQIHPMSEARKGFISRRDRFHIKV